MTRPNKTVVMRLIIDALRNRPLSRDELKTLLTRKFLASDDALRKRRDRYIHELTSLGIVELRGDKYCLTLPEEETETSYDTMLTHSLSLIPALRQIARIENPRYTTPRYASKGEHINEENMRLLIDCTEDHLRYYPDIWKRIDKRKRIEAKVELMEDEFLLNLMEKLKKEHNGEPVVEPGKERKHQSFMGTNIPSLIYSRLLYGTLAQIKLEGEKIWFGGSLIAKGPHLLNGVREFMIRETEEPLNIEAVKSIEKTRNSTIKIGQEIEHEIRIIILRIESGFPLRRGCEICAATDNAL